MVALFDSSPLHWFVKFNNFLWVCWFLAKNLLNFVSILKTQQPWYFYLQSRSSKPSYSDGTTKIIDETNSTIAAWGAIICAILGCLGNVLTIYVLLRKKSLRKHSTTPFLLSLVGFSKPKPNPKGKLNKYPFHKSSNTFQKNSIRN